LTTLMRLHQKIDLCESSARKAPESARDLETDPR
jgi:hypothetical protein